jgi:hypothetical protein
LTDKEVVRLKEIWSQAIADPTKTIDVPDVGMWKWMRLPSSKSDRGSAGDAAELRLSDPAPIRFNYVACSVLYALAKHGRMEEIVELAKTAPENDPVLRGEIVHVMARTRKAEYVPEVLQRIRTAWSENAAKSEFEYGLRRKLDSKTPPRSAMLAMWSAPFDLSHRVRPMRECVTRHLRDPAAVRDLLTDRGLATYLRLWLIGHLNYSGDPSGSLLELAQEELEALMQAEPDELSPVRLLAEDLQEMLRRRAEQ